MSPPPQPNAAGTPRVSVVMPAYNEAEAIASAIEEVRVEVLDRLPRAELIVVDDGSTDATGRIADGIAAHDPRIRVVHQPNAGHGGALMTGMDAASGAFLLLVDSDRQIALSAFPAAWAEVERGRDGVFGVRRRRHDPALRLQLTRWVRAAIRLLFGVRLHDANVPFKLLRREIWLDAKRAIPPGTLAPSLFLAVYALRRGRDIQEMDIEHRPRDTGEVSIQRLKLLTFCWRGLRQLVAFRRGLNDAG